MWRWRGQEVVLHANVVCEATNGPRRGDQLHVPPVEVCVCDGLRVGAAQQLLHRAHGGVGHRLLPQAGR